VVNLVNNYYATRQGRKPDSLDFLTLKRVFLSIYKNFKDQYYFLEATGYKCVDRDLVSGKWGEDPSAIIYQQTKLLNRWPIEDRIQDYDEQVLFTMIEFLYDYISKPLDLDYHGWDNCGFHATKYDDGAGKLEFAIQINELLKNYSNGFELFEGRIRQLPPSQFESLVKTDVVSFDPKNIDERVKQATNKYLKYGSDLDDKKQAIRTLTDVLEFLKKAGVKLKDKDDSDLFQIINNFDIRHHNTRQHGDYDKDVWYDWMFYTFLASIHALVKISGKSKKLITSLVI